MATSAMMPKITLKIAPPMMPRMPVTNDAMANPLTPGFGQTYGPGWAAGMAG